MNVYERYSIQPGEFYPFGDEANKAIDASMTKQILEVTVTANNKSNRDQFVVYQGYVEIHNITGTMKPIRKNRNQYEYYDGGWLVYPIGIQNSINTIPRFGESVKINRDSESYTIWNTLACYKCSDYSATVVRMVKYEIFGFDDDGDEYGRQVRLYPPEQCRNLTVAREFHKVIKQKAYGRNYEIDPERLSQKNVDTGYVRTVFEYAKFHRSPIIPLPWAYERGTLSDQENRAVANIVSGSIRVSSMGSHGNIVPSRLPTVTQDQATVILHSEAYSTALPDVVGDIPDLTEVAIHVARPPSGGQCICCGQNLSVNVYQFKNCLHYIHENCYDQFVMEDKCPSCHNRLTV